MIAQLDILKGLVPQAHISVLAAGLKTAAGDSLDHAAQALPGTTLVKSADKTDIGDALILALRTAPEVLAIAGTPDLVSETLGGLLALQEEGIALPSIALLNATGDFAAATALGMTGSISAQLERLNTHVRGGEAKTLISQYPLLRLAQGPQLIRLGLVFSTGRYAQGLGGGYEKLYHSGALMKLHMFSPSSAEDGEEGLARIAPDKGGSLSTYLSGAIVTALPLPLLARAKVKRQRPVRYLAVERSRKARVSALRAFGGQLDRAQPFYGVHLGAASTLSMRLPGPHRMDAADLTLEASFSITPTQALPFIDLAATA